MEEAEGARRLEEQLKKIETVALGALGVFGLIVLFFSAAAGAHGLPALAWDRALNNFAASLMTIFAGLLLGSMLGFLFGIPKTLQKSQGSGAVSGDASGGPAFSTNTSLEEISDWLTKIIVGLGLVEFERILQAIYWAALTLATLVTGKAIEPVAVSQWWSFDPAGPVGYFYALIVASVLGGLLFTYLETRTRLAMLFTGAQDVLSKRVKSLLENSNPAILPGDVREATTSGAAIAAVPASSADRQITEIPRNILETPDQVVKWAAAQARQDNYGLAVDTLKNVLDQNPNNVNARLRMAEVLHLQGNVKQANEYERKAAELAADRSQRISILRNAAVAALYAPPPEGFEAALATLDMLIKLEPRDEAMCHAWLACAYGQKYRWLKTTNSDAAELAAARAAALQEVRNSIRLVANRDAPSRALLRKVLDPDREKSDPNDDDLADFKGDAEFRAAIYDETDPKAGPSDAGADN